MGQIARSVSQRHLIAPLRLSRAARNPCQPAQSILSCFKLRVAFPPSPLPESNFPSFPPVFLTQNSPLYREQEEIHINFNFNCSRNTNRLVNNN